MLEIVEGESARALITRAQHTPSVGVASNMSIGRVVAPPTGLRSRRILVAVDNLLVADSICETLQAQGYAVLGPTGSLQEACALARAAELDGAVLNMRLGQDPCLLVATLLKARGIPFAIVTGTAASLRPPGLDPAVWIPKPLDICELAEAIGGMMAQPASASVEAACGSSLQLDRKSSGATIRTASTASPSCIDEAAPCDVVASAGGLRSKKSSAVRVLLVEGDPRTRAKLAAVLARQGLEVQSLDEEPALQRSIAEARGRAVPTEKIVCGKLVIDVPQRRAWWDGAEVRLTAGEFAIVVLLVTHAGCCVDNRTVYDSLHYKGFMSGHGEKGFWVNVRSAIRRIRHKFKATDRRFAELENARGFGYRWREPS